MTKPNYDGPLRTLPTGATVTSAVFEFEPDGTAYTVVSGTTQSIPSSETITVTAQRQIQVGNGQWRRQNPASIAAASASSRSSWRWAILTVVSLGVAQLFAASTRVNIIARGQTSTTMLAEQKIEQIRSLTWGFDTNGEGLPVSDTTSDLTVYPTTQNGSGLNPSPADSLEQNTHRLRRFRRCGRRLGRDRRHAARDSRLHPPMVDSAAADEPEQHAGDPGARHANRKRGGSPRDVASACPDAGRHAPGDGEDEEGVMSAIAHPRLGSEAGYSLIELLVSAAIMLTVTGAIFSLMNPAQGSSEAQTEIADVQQRMRVGSDALFKELVMAGAGVYHGSTTGSLINFFAPILPRRSGAQNPDPATVFRPDAISLTYIPNSYTQTTISQVDAGAVARAESQRPRAEMPQEGPAVRLHGRHGRDDLRQHGPFRYVRDHQRAEPRRAPSASRAGLELQLSRQAQASPRR